MNGINIGFIGSGVMGEGMIAGVLNKQLAAPSTITTTDPRPERLAELAETYKVNVSDDNREAVRGKEVIVLSVKPQTLSMVMESVKGLITENALVLSIVAGAKIERISRGLQHDAVVRVMPNTPAQIGLGMSVWTATDAVSKEQRAQAKAILGALGEEIFVEHEGFLDMATALSGTGPAYVFLFMEALIDAGVHMGFPRYISEKLVRQTIRGSLELASQSGRHPAELRNMVTSPGGTSAEALYQLEKGGLRTVISKAVWAAYQKTVYLGSMNDE